MWRPATCLACAGWGCYCLPSSAPPALLLLTFPSLTICPPLHALRLTIVVIYTHIHPALQAIPDGLLVFMPSYSLLDRLMQRWKVGGCTVGANTLRSAGRWAVAEWVPVPSAVLGGSRAPRKPLPHIRPRAIFSRPFPRQSTGLLKRLGELKTIVQVRWPPHSCSAGAAAGALMGSCPSSACSLFTRSCRLLGARRSRGAAARMR